MQLVLLSHKYSLWINIYSIICGKRCSQICIHRGKNMASSPLNMEMCSICTNPSSLQMFIFTCGFAILFALCFIYRSAFFNEHSQSEQKKILSNKINSLKPSITTKNLFWEGNIKWLLNWEWGICYILSGFATAYFF